MADDKKNIPDAGKVDNPPELGKVEQAVPPVQDQPAPAKTEAPVVEGASKGGNTSCSGGPQRQGRSCSV